MSHRIIPLARSPKTATFDSQRGALRELRALAEQPDERAALARELVGSSRAFDVLGAALSVLREAEGGIEPDLKPLLRERYQWFHANGKARDQGCFARVALLEAMRGLVDHGDRVLLDDALFTYEFLPAGEVATFLRAAALLALAELDPEAATWQGTRLLLEPPPHTQTMTGEPAVTAARLLAAQGRALPLYAVAAAGLGAVPDLVAECLRLLATDLPGALLGPLVQTHLHSGHDVIIVGAIDLCLEHADGEELAPVVAQFLQTTKRREVHGYLAAAIVASRKATFVATLLQALKNERDPAKLRVMIDALELLPEDDERSRAMEDARKRIDAR